VASRNRISCALAASIIACISQPALGQPCEWDGERTICPVSPQSSGGDSLPFGIQPGWLSSLFRHHPKPVDPAFSRDLEAYSSHFQTLWENSRTLDRVANLRAPKSENELSRRIDLVLETVWPEYSSNLQQYSLFHRQSAFYDRDNADKRRAVEQMRADLAAVREQLPALRGRLAEATQSLNRVRALEAELSSLALGLLNDRRSEDRATASLLVFAQSPGVTVADLDPRPAIAAVPGRTDAWHLQAAGFAPPYAAERLPSEFGPINIAQPPPDAPVAQKLSILQVVSRDMQTMWFSLPPLRSKVAGQRSENESLAAEKAQVSAQLVPALSERSSLQQSINDAEIDRTNAEANAKVDARTIITEVVVDLALDQASEEMRSLVEHSLGADGLSAEIPTNRTEALIDLARRGRNLLIPASGYERQWDAFLHVQGQTWELLNRNEGFMKDAAQLAATGNPAAMEAYAEKVFANLKWQSFEYVKTVGMSAVPEDEEKSVVEKVFDKLLARKKQQEMGD
jgi:hypothetical protein